MAKTTTIDTTTSINFDNNWIVDYSCSHYLIGDDSKFSSFRHHLEKESIIIADNTIHSIEKEGIIIISDKENDSITPNNMFYIPSMKENLFSMVNAVDW